MRSLLPTSAVLLSLGFVVGADEQALRRVEVYLSPGPARTEVMAKLQAIGFVPDRDAGSAELLRGRLPEKALEAVANSPLVKRVAVGPVVQSAPASKPASYKVRLRYYIQAERTRHVLEFKRLLGDLQAAGFVKGKGLEQEELYDEPINGTIPASGVERLLRAPYLQTALLVPEGHTLPEGDKPVMVRMDLNTKFGLTQQKELREKTLAMLRPLGWRPCVGYDHKDHRQLMGWLPAKQLESLVLAKTTRDPNAKRDLQVEMPLPPKADPFDVDGWVLVNVEVVYKPRDLHDELLTSLQSLGFELAPNGEDREGLSGIIRGRLPTRSIPRASRLDGVQRFKIDNEGAVERLAPIRKIEVIPEPEGSEPPAETAAPAEAAPMSKLSPDLRKYLGELGENATQPIRVEVVLRGTPTELDDEWRQSLAGLRGAIGIEGRVGPLVTGQVRPAGIEFLASRDEVSSIRLPQASRPMILPPFDPKKPVDLPVDFVPLGRETTAPSTLGSLPRRSTPHRAAVIDSDFRGFERFVGKELPKQTQLLDFTAERNTTLLPDPVAGDGNEWGVGTRLALALMATAPADELLLVRVSPEGPYMMEQIARCVEGRGWRSDAIALRELELKHEAGQLDEERTALRVRRRQTLNDFGDDEETRAKREAYFKDQKAFDAKERDFKQRQERFVNFIQRANPLKDVDTVLCGMLWSDGHPSLPGSQPGLRYLGLHRGEVGAPLPKASWLQAVPRKPGTTWTGLFRDGDADEAMEFAARDGTANEQRDLSFLAWRPHAWQKGTPDKNNILWQELPGGAVVQVTLQWQEVHSPAWKQSKGEDHYRRPLAPMQLVVLKQRDPKGATSLPDDAFDVAAQSPAWVDRIENDRRTAIYEIVTRFQVPEGGGRYAVRVEGRAPDSTQPPGGSRLPDAQKAELRPQLKIDVVDPAHRAQGRVVLQNQVAD